jgi:rubrerythrin
MLREALQSETDDGCKISSSRVKWLTGADTITGRNPHDKEEKEVFVKKVSYWQWVCPECGETNEETEGPEGRPLCCVFCRVKFPLSRIWVQQ